VLHGQAKGLPLLRAAPPKAGFADMSKDSRRETRESGVLAARAARRLVLRPHDREYRLSMVVATTMCARYRQVMAAIKG
jgi:hypothetical protein